MGRPRVARLSPEIIGQAAIDLVESGAELRVVALADRLGVHVSSLYHHVGEREGVLRAMRGVLATKYEYAPPTEQTWQEKIRFNTEYLWRIFAEHPRSFQLLITLIVDEPDQFIYYSALVEALTEAGLPDDDVLTTLGVIDAFTFGAALDALSPDVIFDTSAANDRLRSLLSNYPTGATRNREVFERGIDLIILGIETRVAATRPLSRSRG